MTDAAKPTKSARTRAVILDTARALFAERGYDRTTVRDIAAAAGINAALVVRYFGGKDGLFARATQIDLHLPDLAAVPAHAVGATLARHFLDLWEGPNGGALRVLLAASVSDPDAADRLRKIFAGQVVPAITAAAPDGVPSRAALASSQLLGIALCRYVLKLPPLVAMDRAALAAALGPTLQAYVAGPLPAG